MRSLLPGTDITDKIFVPFLTQLMAFGSIGGRATAMMRFVHCWVEDEHLKVMHDDDVQWVGVG